MKHNEIAIFSVSKTITQRITNLLIERGLDIPVYEFHYSDVLEKANEMILSGVKIFISRGGTAALLRSNLSIPVVEIAHDFHGIYRILHEAKVKSHKIAAVGFPQFCNALRHYQTMTSEEFKICQVYNHNDIENVIKNLSEDNYQMVIGGLTVAEMARKYGLDVMMGDTDNISIEQAINESLSLLKYINKENNKLLISHSALNQSREGIMCIDSEGEVIDINMTGVSIFQCQVGDKILLKRNFKEIYSDIINETNIKDKAIDISGTVTHVSIKHFLNRKQPYSIITGVNKPEYNWHADNNNKNSLRGFTTSYSFDNIIGHSDAIMEVIQKAKQCAGHDLPIHLFGETGTGKELFAQSIHQYSDRKSLPFIAVNCAAIPESMLESELFGYADGAFTNARRGGKPGLFEIVMGGTMFIDEISEAPLSVQVKLLRVLQEKQFTRLGGDTLLTANFQLITASNKDLQEQVKADKFRQDLYYRINILELRLPPLRDRADDILLLIESMNTRNDKKLTFDGDALNLLKNHTWPGNIRELQAIIYRLNVLSDGNVVTKSTLQQMGLIPSNNQSDITNDPIADISVNDTDLLKTQEKKLISGVMQKMAGDRAKAALILGVSPTTLWRKIKEYQIKT